MSPSSSSNSSPLRAAQSRRRPGRWQRLLSIIASVGILSGAATIAASSPAGAAATNIDFSQCSNKNPTLGNCVWLNGDLNKNNSQWFEGMSVPQRVLVRGIIGASCLKGRRYCVAAAPSFQARFSAIGATRAPADNNRLTLYWYESSTSREDKRHA